MILKIMLLCSEIEIYKFKNLKIIFVRNYNEEIYEEGKLGIISCEI